MNLLNALHQLLGGQQARPQPTHPAPLLTNYQHLNTIPQTQDQARAEMDAQRQTMAQKGLFPIYGQTTRPGSSQGYGPPGLQVRPLVQHGDYRTNPFGTDDSGPAVSQGMFNPPLQTQPQKYTIPLPQGGQYNPGAIPLQQSNINYQQGPQPTTPWYDF